MTYPHQFGLAQIVLAGVAIAAVVMLLSSVVGRRQKVHSGDGSPESTARGRRLRLRPGRAVTGVTLLVVSILVLWFATVVQTYLGLTGEVKAAHVLATPVSNSAHELTVDLTLYDDDGKAYSRHTYQVEGDLWVLQADIVELHHWVNVLGMHSGYKVTRLFGERLDGVSPTQHQIFLNGGDGDFFADMRGGKWWTRPFVRSAYGNAVISAPGEFDVYISQDAIKARASNG
ncbi:hypothetical protein MB901379_01366 [Mycobacterium basiliense]|uniref:Uncharacterized protein n=1 Tax=Mycobacterium basiliense TaxID=2094119 RepID=A0A3S4FLB7_9MYCO|nr:hypothetical protein [Mycobacterium basiliense]VDM87816.1 hypothetical protein MB901379_01366 [Mycobacterium basiliense]